MKLSASQIEASYLATSDYDMDVDELPSMDEEIDETVYRTTMKRKEIRNKALRDRGEIIGNDSSKHRKY